MKLYYSKAACSMAVHIVLEEAGFSYEAIQVDLTKDPTEDFLKVNPLGQVPVLVLDNGEALTEVALIVQYLADQKPELGLAPKNGAFERYRLQELLNFIATEVHKGFGTLWALDRISQDENAQRDIRNFAIAMLESKFDVIEQKIGSKPFLMPSGYTVADAYLYTILNWANFLKVDLSHWPNLKAHMSRVRERPATIRVLKAERLMPS